eukprot:SAG22_NODE_1199_length_5185_cov_5.251278_5_plen_499_part_00
MRWLPLYVGLTDGRLAIPAGSSIRLVPAAEAVASAGLGRLKFRLGVSSWVVVDPADTDAVYASRDEVPAERTSKGSGDFPATIWPPSGGGEADRALCRQLERGCLRVLPHDQDTGGFFVSVFEKLGATTSAASSAGGHAQPATAVPAAAGGKLRSGGPGDSRAAKAAAAKPRGHHPWSGKKRPPVHDPTATYSTKTVITLSSGAVERELGPCNSFPRKAAGSKQDKKGKREKEENQRRGGSGGGGGGVAKGPRGRPIDLEELRYYPVPFAGGGVLAAAAAFYNLEGAGCFPWARCIRRGNDGENRKVYLVSEAAMELLDADAAQGRELKVVSAGCKVFHRHAGQAGTATCPMRLSQESAPLMLRFLLRAAAAGGGRYWRRHPRVVGLNLADLIGLTAALPAGRESWDISVDGGVLTTPGAATELALLEPGSVMFYLAVDKSLPGEGHDDVDAGEQDGAAVVCWKGWGTVVPYVQKDELASLRAHWCYLGALADIADSE